MAATDGNVVVHKHSSGFEVEVQTFNMGMLTRSLVGTATNVVPVGRAYFELLRSRQLGESKSTKYVLD
jgi:hypothetical protein